MEKKSQVPLGELLLKKGFITNEQLATALKEQTKSGEKIGQIIVDLGFATDNDVLSTLSEQINIPFLSLTHHKFDKELIHLLPGNHAKRLKALILGRDEQQRILVGMSDPLNLPAYDEVKRIIKKPFDLVLVRENELLHMVDLLYRRTGEIKGLAQDLTVSFAKEEELGDIDTEKDVKPVAKLLNSLFEDALQVQASDIHIEPDEHILRIRQRVDGVLQEQIIKEKGIAKPLTLRLKLMGGLNISERRLPQDGRFNIHLGDKKVDVRLSTMPIEYGESVVMRLLDQSSVSLDLSKIGMPSKILSDFRRTIHHPYGIILVTGPTGSGKTTTLYSALTELNSPEKKVITVEDPVEYHLPRISQVQVNEKIELTFARVLRSVLRQDPDIILIGEIRDRETAEIAIRAALTGHLVLATLHTNDAISTPIRLMDMGVEGYLVGTSLRASLAQRLVKRLCGSCRVEYEPNSNEREAVISIGGERYAQQSFYCGRGCTYCNGTGFDGRVGVYELFELTSSVIHALNSNDPNVFYNSVEDYKQNHSLALSALEAAASGLTSISEFLRIAGEIRDDPMETPELMDASVVDSLAANSGVDPNNNPTNPDD